MKTSLPYSKICLIFNKRLVHINREEREAVKHAHTCVLGTSGKQGDGEGKVMHMSVDYHHIKRKKRAMSEGI